MKCNCGYKIEIPKFCPKCGTSIPKIDPETTIAPKPISPILTVQQAADFLSVSKPTIYQLIRDKGLPWFSIGQHKRFITEEIMEWAKSNTLAKPTE